MSRLRVADLKSLIADAVSIAVGSATRARAGTIVEPATLISVPDPVTGRCVVVTDEPGAPSVGAQLIAPCTPLVGDRVLVLNVEPAARFVVGLVAGGATGGRILCTSTDRPTTPYVGMAIHETDTGNDLTWQSATTGWTPTWNLPWGIVGEWEHAADVTPVVGAEKDVLTSTSVTLVPHRIYRFRAWARTISSTVALDAFGLRIKDGATVITESVADSVAAGLGGPQPPPEAYRTTGAGTDPDVEAAVIASGAHTFTVKAFRLAGTGNGTLGGATYPVTLCVDDMGADGAPA